MQLTLVMGKTGTPVIDATSKDNVCNYMRLRDLQNKGAQSVREDALFATRDRVNVLTYEPFSSSNVEQIVRTDFALEDNGICVRGSMSEGEWSNFLLLLRLCDKLIEIHFHDSDITEERLQELFVTLRCRTSLCLESCNQVHIDTENTFKRVFSRFMETSEYETDETEFLKALADDQSREFTGHVSSIHVIQGHVIEDGIEGPENIWNWSSLKKNKIHQIVTGIAQARQGSDQQRPPSQVRTSRAARQLFYN